MAQAAVPTTLRMTWEEFVNWNPEHQHWEWVDGEVIEIMSADRAHQNLLRFLVSLLDLFTEAFQLGEIYFAPFLMHLAFRPSGREPDIIFVASENLDRITDQYLDGPADLAVEIVSPESRTRDKSVKLAEYETAGIWEYWVIDHIRRETFFYQRDASGKLQRVYEDENGRYESMVVMGFWINVNWLWQEPKPRREALRQLGVTI